MRKSLKFVVPSLAASLLLAACGGSSHGKSAQSSGGANALVRTASSSKLGATVLVNAGGRTLYSLSAERNGRFICAAEACLQLWHPLKASNAGMPTGTIGSLGTIKRPDGTLQVTYKGMPLYTFAHDQKAGDATGQGFKDVGTWSAVTTGAKSAKPAAPASGGYGSGY